MMKVQGLFLGILLLGAGCQSARNAVYCVGEDLTDIVVADATVSMGTDMGAHVMATELLQAKAYSYEDLYRFGLGARRFGIWECEREGWDFSIVHSSQYRWNQKEVAAFTPLPAVSGKMRSESGVKAMFAESVDEVGVGAHLFVLGGRIGIRPLEIVDLFANLLTLDPLHDNLSWRQRKTMRDAKKAAQKLENESDSPETIEDPAPEEMQQQMEQMQKEMEQLRQSIEDRSFMDDPAF